MKRGTMARNKKNISRRTFIQRSVAGLAVASGAGVFASCSKSTPTTPSVPTTPSAPLRPLGATGREVSLLTFGGGSQFLKNKNGEWEPLLERAVALGVNLFDTCSSYKWGAKTSSEERFGEILPAHRKKILISTKFESRDPAKALKEFDESLARMKTDYVDALMIHNISPSEDIASLEKGVYKEMVRLKQEGAVRHIGFSSMDSAENSRQAIEALDFDLCLIALNPTRYGAFARKTLPAARAKKMGVLAMKVMRNIVGEKSTPGELLEYAWSLDGVASALVGHCATDKASATEILEENVRLAETYAAGGQIAMSPHKQRDLEKTLAHLAGPHALCWARHGYRDGKARHGYRDGKHRHSHGKAGPDYRDGTEGFRA